jgi:hypothetical protein
MKTPTKPTQRNLDFTPTKAHSMVNHQPDYILNSGMNTSNAQYPNNNNISNPPPFPFSEKSLKMLQGETDQIPTKEAVSNILELLTRKDNLVKLSEYASSAQQSHAPITIDAPLKTASSSYSYSSAPVTPTKQHAHHQQQSEKIVRPLSPPTRDSSANRPRRNSGNNNNNNTVASYQPSVTSDSASPVPRWAGSISAPSPSSLPKPVFFTSPAASRLEGSFNTSSSSSAIENTVPVANKSSAARQLQFHSMPVVNAPAPQMVSMPFPFPPVAPQQHYGEQPQQLHPTVQQMMAHVAASSTVATNNQDLGQLSNQLKMMLNISSASVRS